MELDIRQVVQYSCKLFCSSTASALNFLQLLSSCHDFHPICQNSWCPAADVELQVQAFTSRLYMVRKTDSLEASDRHCYVSQGWAWITIWRMEECPHLCIVHTSLHCAYSFWGVWESHAIDSDAILKMSPNLQVENDQGYKVCNKQTSPLLSPPPFTWSLYAVTLTITYTIRLYLRYWADLNW